MAGRSKVAIVATFAIAGLAFSIAAPMLQESGSLSNINQSKSSHKAVATSHHKHEDAAQDHRRQHDTFHWRHQLRSGGLEDIVQSASASSSRAGVGHLEGLLRVHSDQAHLQLRHEDTEPRHSLLVHQGSPPRSEAYHGGTGGLEDIFLRPASLDAKDHHAEDAVHYTPLTAFNKGKYAIVESSKPHPYPAVAQSSRQLSKRRKHSEGLSRPPTTSSLRTVGAVRWKAKQPRRSRSASQPGNIAAQLTQDKQALAKGSERQVNKAFVPLQSWMKTYKRPIQDLYRVYEKHTGCNRTTSKRKVRSTCTLELADELLSGDAERERAAVIAIGIPEDRQKGLRTKYWGHRKNLITDLFARHHGISYPQAVDRLDVRLTKPIAQLMMNPATFKKGADMLPALRHIGPLRNDRTKMHH